MTGTFKHIECDERTVEVKPISEEVDFWGGYSENDELLDTRHFIDINMEMTKDKDLDMLSKSEIVKLLRKQEEAWENAKGAVECLERRIRILEQETLKSEFLKKPTITVIQDNIGNRGQNPHEQEVIGHYSCVYVSPIYDDKKGSIMYRTQVVEDNHGWRSRSFNDRKRYDEKGLEIERLKAEMQMLRLQDREEERNSIADKFIDKMDIIRKPTISQSRSHNGTQLSRAELDASIEFCQLSAENPAVSMNRYANDQGLLELHLKNGFSPNGFMKIVEKRLAAEKAENGEDFFAVPDLNRSILAADWLQSSNEVQQTVSSFLATMQGSVENLCNNFKICESSESDLSKIISGAIEDELFIVKKTLCKLTEMCQETSYRAFSCANGKEAVDVKKPGDVQDTMDGMMQQLAQSEFKVMALESSSMEKDKKVEDLEKRVQVILKETEVIMMEKLQLTTALQEMHKEGAKKRHQIEELLSINEELLIFSQAKEDQLGNLQETREGLMQKLVQFEDNLIGLESLLLEKDKEMEELNRRLKANQMATDDIIIEKIECTAKIQAMNKVAEEQKHRIEELVSINQELLDYAQSKEDQMAFLNKEGNHLQGEDRDIFEDNSRLTQNLQETSMGFDGVQGIE